ncbi:MAG: SIR2 family protein [Bryobacteraceae bacterium]
MGAKLPDELTDTLTGNKIVVFAGAGISKDAPSDLPLAAELQDAIVDALLRRIHPPLGNNERASALRKAVRSTIPESLYQMLRDQLGTVALRLLNSALSCGRPNWLHETLARLADSQQVAAVITTNFDLHIETAMAGSHRTVALVRSDADLQSLRPAGLPLIKIHGSIDEPASIVTTLEQVGRGLTPPRSKVLKRLLRRHVFLFVGWSDSDIDLSPALMSGGRPFVWIQHDSGWNISAVTRAGLYGLRKPEEISVDALMRAHGGWIIRADTGAAVAALCRAFAIPVGRRKSCSATSEWRDRINAWADGLSPGQRLTAVAGICDRLGYLRDAIRMYGHAEREFRSKRDRASVAGALWDRGIVLTRASQWARASHSFLRAITIYEELGQSDFAIRARFDSVVIALRQRRWDEVIGICRKALCHFKRSGNEDAVAHVCHNLGIAFSMIGHQRRALLLWKLSERLHYRCGDLRGIAEVFTSMAGYHLRAGSPAEALRYLLRAERLFARFGGEEELAYVVAHRSSVLLKLNRPEEALIVLGDAMERAAQSGNRWLTTALKRKLKQVQARVNSERVDNSRPEGRRV